MIDEPLMSVQHDTTHEVLNTAMQSVEALNVAASGNRTVLLVEDEVDLLELITEVLQMSGFSVLPAPSSRKAIELWRGANQKVDLLFTDIKLPEHPDGFELAHQLADEKPKLKVIYTSGHGPDSLETSVQLRQGENYLQKPFGIDQLLSTIDHALTR